MPESIPNSEAVSWLLEADNPPVRYLALTELLGRPLDDFEVLEARRALMTTGPVAELLALQSGGGFWGKPDRFYTDKYGGTAWQLIVLAELGASVDDPRVRQACEFVFEWSQESTEGGFSMQRASRSSGGLPSQVIPCLTGNMVFSLARLGYLGDSRLQHAIDWLAKHQRFDDGDGPGSPAKPACWGKHSCHMGVVKALKGLAALPPHMRSPEVRRSIERGAEYLLIHHIHKQSHDLSKVSKPGWLRFGFPLMYQTDVLEILDILTSLGYADYRMRDALDAVSAKRDGEGRWLLENSFNGKMPVNVECVGAPSKWVTLRAMRVQRRVAGSSPV